VSVSHAVIFGLGNSRETLGDQLAVETVSYTMHRLRRVTFAAILLTSLPGLVNENERGSS